MITKQVFTNQTTNGYSDVFEGNRDAWIKISGTWGGASVSLYAKTNHANDDYSSTGMDEKFSQDTAYEPRGKQTLTYKLRLENAGATTDLNAFIIE
jgi:hypothetical protein